MSIAEWAILLSAVQLVVGGGGILGTYVMIRVKLAEHDTEIRNLKEMREDWRKFVLKLQEME